MAADADRREELALLSARIDSLRREVYSRAGSESPLVEAVDPVTGELVQLRAAERQLRAAERELQAIVSALREPEVPLEPAAGREAEDTAGSNSAGPEIAGAAPDAAPRRPRRIVAALIAAAVLLAAGSFAAGTWIVGHGPSGEGMPSAGSSSRAAVPSASRGAGLAIFDAPQRPEDIPPVLLGFGVAPASTRSFGNFGPAPGVARTYVARTISGLVCLAIVLPDQTSSMTCVAEDRYSAEGIRLRLTTTETVPSPEPGGQPDSAFHEYYWSRDGNLSVESNVLRFPAAPHA